jgi:hypothetical protein
MTSVPIESSSKYTHMPMAQISFVSQPGLNVKRMNWKTIVKNDSYNCKPIGLRKQKPV